MNSGFDYLEKNRDSWNKRTDYHVKSDFYDVEGFLKGNTSLNDIELNLLGDTRHKSILHLQCHFGQDTISLARLGANVTGIDFSDNAIHQAKLLAKKAETDAEFICCNIYDLPQHLHKEFDIVFTSYGTIGWLPDLDKWAEIISGFLKPDGKFIFVEFHPVVWMFDDNFEKIGYNYFNDGPIIEAVTGTYAEPTAPFNHEYATWNHSMSEVINNLIKHKLHINFLEEFDYSPYNCFRETIQIESKKFRIKHLDNKIPLVYSIVATRNVL